MPVADLCRSQRAFRERKERHVRDLELKISAFESTVLLLQSDNERLTLAVQSLSTENEILRARAIQTPGSSSLPSASSTPVRTRLYGECAIDDSAFSVQPLDVRSNVSAADKQRADSYRNTNSTSVSASQTWDLIQSHPLAAQGRIDITRVCERLKAAAKYDDHGVVFKMSTVLQAIEESSSGGIDQLL
jgi:AP-1-like factor